MKMLRLLPLLSVLALGVRAESAKSYQVTGPVVALTDSVITVQKDDEKWEINRATASKPDGKLAVGDRVTVHYRMTADRIEIKETGGKASGKTDAARKKSTNTSKQ